MTTDLRMSADELAPPSSTERAVGELWMEVLQTAQLPAATDNFFALGGDSMAMVILEFRIKEEFSVDLPAGVVLGAPTLRELSALVETAAAGSRCFDTQGAGVKPFSHL